MAMIKAFILRDDFIGVVTSISSSIRLVVLTTGHGTCRSKALILGHGSLGREPQSTLTEFVEAVCAKRTLDVFS